MGAAGRAVGGEQAVGVPRIGPSRLWYWVAGAALLGSVACVVLGVFVLFFSFSRQVAQFQRGPLPGQTVLSFDSPGGYTVYFETDTGAGTGVYWGSGSDTAEDTVTLPAYSMSLVAVGGGEQILLRPYGIVSTYTSGGHAGRAMRSFHIDTPGRYLLDIVGPRPPVAANVAVGQGTGRAGRVLVLTVPASLILFCGAVALAIVVAVRRRRAQRLLTPSPWAGTSRHEAGAGWFPDPGRGHQLRYWDGQKWTEHVADPVALENTIRRLTWGYAAWWYSLMSPARMADRRMRSVEWPGQVSAVSTLSMACSTALRDSSV